MGFKDVSKRPTASAEQARTDKEYPFESLYDLAKEIFPNGHVARISRHFDVQHRTVQKWISGELKAPDDVVQWLEHQRALLDRLKIHEVTDWADANIERGLDKEVVAAWLAHIYHQLVGDFPK